MSLYRCIGAAALLAAVIQTGATAQIMRFTTNVGSFDMRLNPTNDPNLQPLVDNIVAYIGLGRYNHSAINRAVEFGPGADDDFVLQMGGFMAFPSTPDLWASLLMPVERLANVTVDANNDGAVDFTAGSNTRGTVSLALQQGQPNSGTSSFFINLGDNSSLNGQGFVPFANIQNMATVDRIMRLTQRDLSEAAGEPGNATFTDVPLATDGQIVILEDIQVVSANANFSFVGPIISALELAKARGLGPQSAAESESEAAAALLAAIEADADDADFAASATLEVSALTPAATTVASNVPEPAGATIAALAAAAGLRLRRRSGR